MVIWGVVDVSEAPVAWWSNVWIRLTAGCRGRCWTSSSRLSVRFDRFLAHLSAVGPSLQTVRSYTFDLRDLCAFLLQLGVLGRPSDPRRDKHRPIGLIAGFVEREFGTRRFYRCW